MDRRESIKSLVLGSLVGGLALESCVSDLMSANIIQCLGTMLDTVIF